MHRQELDAIPLYVDDTKVVRLRLRWKQRRGELPAAVALDYRGYYNCLMPLETIYASPKPLGRCGWLTAARLLPVHQGTL